MEPLLHQRCFNHALREAAARCPECRRFFCRECVTEHEDRVVCAACLRQLVKPPLTQRSGFVAVVRAGQWLAGILTVCLFFYFCGQILLSLPSSFHEGALWRSDGSPEP